MTTSGSTSALVLPATLSGLSALFLFAMAVAALAAGGGTFGVGVASFLALWGAAVAVVSYFLARGRPWARGPVVAAALIHLASMVSFAANQPWAWAGAAVALATVIATVRPAATRALSLDRELPK